MGHQKEGRSFSDVFPLFNILATVSSPPLYLLSKVLLSNLTKKKKKNSVPNGGVVWLWAQSKVGLLERAVGHLFCFCFTLSPLIRPLSMNCASTAPWGHSPHFSVSFYVLMELSTHSPLFSPGQNKDSTQLATMTILGTGTWCNWCHLQGLLLESTTFFSVLEPGRL